LNDTPSMRLRAASVRRWTVTGLLALGWGVAAALYVATPPVAENGDVYDLQHSRKLEREIEGVGGKAVLLTNDLNSWVAGLFHGTNLAYTIAIATGALAGGCWLLWPAAGSDKADHEEAR